MKTLWIILTGVLLANAIALGVGIGWLNATDRLDRERFQRVVEMFSITVSQERADTEQALALEEKARQQALEAARLESAGDGPVTLIDRLAAQQGGDELAVQRVARMEREAADLKRHLELAKQIMAKQSAKIHADREAYARDVEQQQRARNDENFQRAVQMYERVKPKQAVQMFRRLIDEGKTQHVVNYLAMMQQRKAAAVLKAFKTPKEIEQATELIQLLGSRGVQPLTDNTPPDPNTESNPS